MERKTSFWRLFFRVHEKCLSCFIMKCQSISICCILCYFFKTCNDFLFVAICKLWFTHHFRACNWTKWNSFSFGLIWSHHRITHCFTRYWSRFWKCKRRLLKHDITYHRVIHQELWEFPWSPWKCNRNWFYKAKRCLTSYEFYTFWVHFVWLNLRKYLNHLIFKFHNSFTVHLRHSSSSKGHLITFFVCLIYSIYTITSSIKHIVWTSKRNHNITILNHPSSWKWTKYFLRWSISRLSFSATTYSATSTLYFTLSHKCAWSKKKHNTNKHEHTFHRIYHYIIIYRHWS